MSVLSKPVVAVESHDKVLKANSFALYCPEMDAKLLGGSKHLLDRIAHGCSRKQYKRK